MGWHSLLHKNRIPFDSHEARELNWDVFRTIKEQAHQESIQLGLERGEAPDMQGTGRRNAHLLAIAPNANSSIICGTSPSIEPSKANAYTHRTRAGSHLVKNKYLEEELTKAKQNTDKVWSDIITNGGSVQHLDFLSDETKEVFKTAIELDQLVLVEQAADRQEFLCQGQSLNLFFPAGADKKELHRSHFAAWKLGTKGLYYLRTESSQKAENVSTKIVRDQLQDFETQSMTQDECVACQG
jgi:ribonucleoside-diphosphate reductase alpha chain